METIYEKEISTGNSIFLDTYDENMKLVIVAIKIIKKANLIFETLSRSELNFLLYAVYIINVDGIKIIKNENIEKFL